MAKHDYKYEGVGYNGPHLAAMPFDKFKEEVKHNFTEGPNPDERIKALYDGLKKKYPTAGQPAKFVAPKDEAEAAKPLSERETEEPKAVAAPVTTSEPPKGDNQK